MASFALFMSPDMVCLRVVRRKCNWGVQYIVLLDCLTATTKLSEAALQPLYTYPTHASFCTRSHSNVTLLS